jgi:hypothetical protein
MIIMKKEPKNYIYWKSIIEDKEKLFEFMGRGNERQKKEMKKAHKYYEYLNSQQQQDLFEVKPGDTS